MSRSKRRIVIHSALFLPTQGGAELYVHNFSKNLAPAYQVTILARPSRALWKVDTPHRVVRLPSWAIALYFIWMVLRERPDVLHVGLIGYESILLVAIARIARIPSILTYHGTYSVSNEVEKSIPYPVFLLENVSMRIPWSLVACVDYHSQQLLLRRFKIPPNRVRVIPSGVDTDLFRPEPLEKSFQTVNSYTILCPRRIDPKNGIEYLIRAAIICKKGIQGLNLVIAGRTNEGMEEHAKFLHEIVQSKFGSSFISFLGDVEHTKMPRLYSSADIVSIPSLAEARSLSALEAMACEKPVVATKVGGMPEIIRDGVNGVLVNPADVEALSNAIQHLYLNPELRTRLGRNGRTTAMQNSWKDRTGIYEHVYESLVMKRT